MTTKYLAKFEYGRASLIRFGVARETDKTYQPEKSTGEGIVGWDSYIGRVIKKTEPGVFDTAPEAIAYLITKAELHREEMKKAVAQATRQVDDLMELARKLKEGKSDGG